VDLFILIGAGLLGAIFIASQSAAVRVPFVWKLILGGGGGAGVYLWSDMFDHLLAEASISGFITLFVLGGFAGGFAILLYYVALWIAAKR